MIYVHSLIWELSNLEIKCELTGSGDGEAMNRDESEWPEVNTRIWAPRTLPKTRPEVEKITGFRGYQTIVFGGALFFFLYSNSSFLEVCINSEQFVKSEIGMEYLLSPLFHPLLHFSLQPD